MLITNKKPENTIKLLSKIKENLKTEKILTENDRYIVNKKVSDWCKYNKVRHNKAIPYVHETNGRIERFNRTIKDMLKKMNGPINRKFGESIRIYNNKKHMCVGMSYIEAINDENHKIVIRNQEI